MKKIINQFARNLIFALLINLLYSCARVDESVLITPTETATPIEVLQVNTTSSTPSQTITSTITPTETVTPSPTSTPHPNYIRIPDDGAYLGAFIKNFGMVQLELNSTFTK